VLVKAKKLLNVLNIIQNIFPLEVFTLYEIPSIFLPYCIKCGRSRKIFDMTTITTRIKNISHVQFIILDGIVILVNGFIFH